MLHHLKKIIKIIRSSERTLRGPTKIFYSAHPHMTLYPDGTGFDGRVSI